MGAKQSKKRRRKPVDPRQLRPQWTRYEEFAQALLADPFRGPTEQEIAHINECEPYELEPKDQSKPPLLVLAKDNEDWFGHLIKKCNPAVTWKGGDGQKKELGSLLMGTCPRNYAVWSTKLDEWNQKHGGSTITSPGRSPDSSPWGRRRFLREFGKVAVALGITAGGAALGFPAAALGPVLWVAIRRWHASFSEGIGSTGLGAQELQELQNCFDGCAQILGRLITQLGTQIEEIDANTLDPEAAERARGELETRVDTLQLFLEEDVAEMARIVRIRATKQEKKRIMMAKFRDLWNLLTAQEILYINHQILRRVSSQQQETGDDGTPSTQLPGAFGIPGPTAFGGGTAPLTARARAGGESFTFERTGTF